MTVSEQQAEEVQRDSPRCGVKRRFAARILIAAGLLLSLFVAGITFIGIPPLLSAPLLASVNRGAWFCEVNRLTLDPRGGIVAHAVRVFRKGVAGPAVFEGERVHIRVELLALIRSGRVRVREVGVERGWVRSWRWFSDSSAAAFSGGGRGPDTKAEEAAGKLDFLLHLRNVAVLDVPIRDARVRVIRDEAALRLLNLRVLPGDESARGNVEGECVRHPDGRWTGRVSSRVDPHLVLPLLREAGLDLSGVVDRFSFHADAPSLEVNFDLPPDAREPVDVKGRFQASEFAYLGAGIGFANITWQCQWGEAQRRLVLNPLVLVSRGKSLSGSVNVDFLRRTVDGEVLSMLEWPVITRVAEVPRGTVPETWKFGDGLKVHAKGRFAYGNPASSDLEVTVEGRNVGLERFRFDEMSLRWLMKGGRHEFGDIRGRVAGGSMNGWAVVGPDPQYPSGSHYRVRCEILNVELAPFLEMAGARSQAPMEGRLYGTLDLEGTAGKDVPKGLISGSGGISITGGRLFSLPLFGGLTRTLAARFEGVDALVAQRAASATYSIGGGRIKTRDARIEGDFFSVEGEGDCTLDGKLNFSVKVRPATERKGVGPIVRALTSPLSKLLEFRLEGTLTDPQWKSASLSLSSWFENGVRKEKGP